MKTKVYLSLALLGTMLVGCTSNDFIGDDNSPDGSSNFAAIKFGGNANRMTRATAISGPDAATMLDGQFKVYGTKSVSNTWSNVFTNYSVWSRTGEENKTTTNPDMDWEYVVGTQTIKYWDYSATNYHFVAGSPISSFTFNPGSDNKIASATVNGIGGHLDVNETAYPIYIADPVNMVKPATTGGKYPEVQFNFGREQSFVRVGIFETIPGYSISDIKFYVYDESDWGSSATSSNVVLASETAGYFRGVNNGGASGTVTYTWVDNEDPGYSGSYSFSFTSTSLKSSKNWYGGAFSGVPAETTTETALKLYGSDAGLDANGFFTVIPTEATAAPILIKCDYTLTSLDGSGETIKVTGATAAIPAAFCKWVKNTSYTYLFKISDNTNGSTGTPGTDPVGLYPITFDAVVTATAEGTGVGSVTTVSTPSITTYQEGSVTATGIKYVTDEAIYVTVQDNTTGALNALTALDNDSKAAGMVQVYKLSEEANEADLVVTRPTTTETTTIGSSAATINGESVAESKYCTFTPTVAGYYAVEYITSVTGGVPAYTYKVIHVE